VCTLVVEPEADRKERLLGDQRAVNLVAANRIAPAQCEVAAARHQVDERELTSSGDEPHRSGQAGHIHEPDDETG
jgi:hypothetical protein